MPIPYFQTQGGARASLALGWLVAGLWPSAPSIICVGCEQRVPLWDEMEQCFASPEIAALVVEGSGRLTPFQQRVRDMQEESAIELSNQSKERALVGEVI